MAPRNVRNCMKLLLKLTAFLMFVFSTSSTKQCTSMKTERDGYVIRNVGIKLCQLKCAENGQCLGITYDIETLICRLSRAESKMIKETEGHAILASDHSHVPTSSCTPNMCSLGQRCLKTRSGKVVCVQDKKQNSPEESPQHKGDKQETHADSKLHQACRCGDLSSVRQILAQGLVDINSRDEKLGRTPLMVAAKEGHCRIFQFLIGKGADKSEVDNDCNDVLHWACKGGDVSMVKCVIPHYGIKNVRQSALIQAARRGNRDFFKFVVCSGSNLSNVDSEGNNILHRATLSGSVAIMKYIVSQGIVDINSRRKDGKNALMIAALGGKIKVFNFLVSIGCNTSHADINERNILHMASSFGHVKIVKQILSQRLVDINARDRYGKTAAMIAKRGRMRKVYNLLVSRGCPVN